MTKEEMNVFSLRIANSSKTELVVVTYDIILNYTQTACDAYKKGDLDAVEFNLKKAKQFLDNLSSSLDLKIGISLELMNLYRYINSCYVKGIVRRNIDGMDTIVNMIGRLRESFDEISSLDTSGKVMKNSEQVYVGYTYGRTSTLNEVRVR